MERKVGKLGMLVLTTSLVVLVLGFGALGCDKHELDALMELKSAINHPNGTALDGWTKQDETGSPSNCCDWYEVRCGESGQVVSLDLFDLGFSFNSVTGWTRHLRQLTSLQYLDLSDNMLQGMLDVYDIEALKNLQSLDLSYNDIDGFKRSHGNLSSTSKLEKLYLIGNGVKDANTFVESLSLFPSLKTIDLSLIDLASIQTYGWLCQLKNIQEIFISASGLQGQIPMCLTNLRYLQRLRLNENYLDGELPPFGANLTALQILDLRGNNLHGELPPFLANLTTLQHLDLTSNQFLGNLANSPLTKLTSLQEITLSNNNFQIPHTLRPFANHSNLKKLWLDSNNFIPDNAAQQPIVPTFQLTSLSMSSCAIVGKVPHFILSQVSLTYLDLSHNSIGGSFPSWILDNNKPLVFLNLSSNKLIGSLHMSTHNQLTVLDVSNNNISHLSAYLSQAIPNIVFLNLSRNSVSALTPSNFGKMKKLCFLDLTYNHLSAETPKDCFKDCVSLEGLFLSYNNLEVTPSLLSSTSLKILRLNHNNLSGMFPSNLFPSSLQQLDMSNNHLGGRISSKICKLKSLNFLDLSNNTFSGFLPPCFDGSNLICLFLNDNKLNGSLLSVFQNNTFLTILDLGNNFLSGMIPKWVGDFPNLRSLILSHNNFEGEIPTQICFLDHLSILDLSSNKISGLIPHCLGQMPFQPLGEISLLEESISPFQKLYLLLPLFIDDGITTSVNIESSISIQTELEISTKKHIYTYAGGILDEMSAFDLSCNNLSGDIPPELGNMTGVRAFNLSHNKLDGPIPSTLSNLSNIESLDLSYNHLNGSIPFELTRLNTLEVFSVAYNSLSGEIPETAQFGTFTDSYQGNPLLCGAPLLQDCSPHTPNSPEDQDEEDDDGAMDMEAFYASFSVTSVIIFVATLIVLYVNPYWRRAWFYFAEMWITCAYYFIVDGARKAMRASVGVILRIIHCH